jgi:hypothetical protein
MQIQVTPEQIEAMNRGEEIVVLVRMEPQPGLPYYHGADGEGEHHFSDRTAEQIYARQAGKHTWRRCPVAVGDTVTAMCDRLQTRGGCMPPHGGCLEIFCGFERTVRHIAHREKDGVHYWEVRLGR